MKIYTKTGDKGKTSLGSGKRVDKFHPRIECYGTIDELNSVIGLAAAYLQGKKEASGLKTIQNQLFNLGALVACDSPQRQRQLPQITDDHIFQLEQQIDALTQELPELKNFILPGGTTASAALHLARCVCRRAERLAFLIHRKSQLPPTVLIYLNRLSDFLFVLARYCNYREHQPELEWNKDC